MHCRLIGLVFVLLFSFLSVAVVGAQTHQPMLPQTYSEQDVRGWWMSEKLDGIRGYWDGEQLFSKNGTLLNPPAEFTATFPPFPVEGELWGGRNSYEETSSVVLRKDAKHEWMSLRFGIFDVPAEAGSFRQRIIKIQDWLRQQPSETLFVIEQVPVADNEHLQTELERIALLGGEGLIVRDPDADYTTGRSMDILKVKNFEDAEAVVVAHIAGKGKHQGRLGSLVVEIENGTRFRIGTGFTDAERENPPAIGTVISYKFYGLYNSGIPKFPSFLRVRKDSNL